MSNTYARAGRCSNNSSASYDRNNDAENYLEPVQNSQQQFNSQPTPQGERTNGQDIQRACRQPPDYTNRPIYETMYSDYEYATEVDNVSPTHRLLPASPTSPTCDRPKLSVSDSSARIVTQESVSFTTSGGRENYNNHYQVAYRKRQNPLYVSLGGEIGLDKQSSSGSPIQSTMICLLVFAIVLSGLACILASISLLKTTDLSESIRLEDILSQLKSLQNHYEEAMEQLDYESNNLFLTKENLTNRLNLIFEMHNNVTDRLDNLQTNLTSQLQAVEKMPGPPGPGNLSQCRHESRQVGRPIGMPNSTTDWIPSEAVAKEWIVIAVYCSVHGGTEASLENRVDSTYKEYRCNCRGNGSNATSRYCYMNYWLCPLVS